MKNRNGTWLAVTAGVGSQDFEEAANRVGNDLISSKQFEKVVVVTTKDLPSVCPETSSLYRDLMNSNTRGYGYMCWKAEIVNAATQGKWGNYDGVVWIDAGCEVTINPFSAFRLNRFKNFAINHGVACFSLDTLEIQYTKMDVFREFPEVDPEQAGKQIQTTWFLLHGEKGTRIANEWLKTVLLGTHMLDLQPSLKGEHPSFIENRYDQSTFSLVCKKNKIRVMPYRATAGSGSLISYLRGFFNPIWTSRNRVGRSVKSKIHTFLEI